MDEIRKACQLTCKRMNECLEKFSQFKTEKEVKDFLEKDFELAFPTIVASGNGASLPHYEGNSELKKGFCVIDYGIKHKGYCSDITRTIYIGNPTEKEQKTYHYLLKEQNKMLKQCKLNSKVRYIEKAFRKRLGEKNKLFIHSLSHGLGKIVHEPLPLKLKKNNVVTIEPGFYVKNKWGIRIEDDVLINDKGEKEILTKNVTKKLIKIN